MISILLLAALPIGHAAPPDRSNLAKPLKGLTQAYVTYNLNDPNKIVTMSDGDIIAAANKALTDAGITVIGKEDADKYNAAHAVPLPEVDVNIDASPQNNPDNSLQVSIVVGDLVKLARRRSTFFYNDVWNYVTKSYPISGKDATSLPDVITTCAAQFASDLKLANGKN